MPFTPVHFGFAIFVFSIMLFMDPIALLIGTIIIDVEPIFYLITGIGQMHGIMHSTLGVIVFFIPSSFISWLGYKYLKLDRFLPKYNVYISLLSAILGLFSHIFFDAILYNEIMFFYPFSETNGTLYNLISPSAVYPILGIMFLVGALILGLRYYLKYQKKKRIEE
ncbi:MAG: metal-dependent hydrolase [Candidatus Heimdallarchaeota archaeon]|nr:metal-dependent hydrolase [Candidatus Heimdallarchaeota archaeon]